MSNPIKVSVIVPVYNSEAHLQEFIDSLTMQTLQDAEFIFVNDGSSDHSPEILKRNAESDHRICIITQENQGTGAARNAGLHTAAGEFITFADPDDLYPDADILEYFYNLAVTHDAKIVGGSMAMITSDGTLKETFPEGEKCRFYEEDFISYRSYQYDYYFQRFFFKNSHIRKFNLTFPLYKRNQDIPFFVKAMAAAEVFYASSKVSYHYRERGFNTVNWSAEAAADILKSSCDLLTITNEYKYKDLHKRVAKRILVNYRKHIFAQIDNEAVMQQIYESDKLLDHSILEFEDELSPGIKPYLRAYEFYHKLHSSRSKQQASAIVENTVSDPFVSVIIPFYNVEKYVGACLDSVCKQSLKNIEIICVNDGSEDHSMDIIMEYAEKDSRITVLSKENGGISSARNAGLKCARAEYVYFLDSDDMIKPDALEKLHNCASGDRLDILLFEGECIYENEDLEEKFSNARNYYKKTHQYKETYTGLKLLTMLLRDKEYRVTVQMQLVRRSFLTENNISFVSGIVHEDNPYTFSCLLQAKRAACFHETFFLRRLRPGSTMTSAKTFAHAYGYFVSSRKMAESLQHCADTSPDTSVLDNAIKYMSDSARWIYANLDKTEQDLKYGLSAEERVLFESLLDRH
ncbi:MAG: glycosyltransferase [Eubacterium sp.]|nr:glycosyltransferase [Eubacterium sp.]